MMKVTFRDPRGNQRTVEALPGTTLLALAQREDIPIDTLCGGQAVCGACRIQVVRAAGAALSEPDETEIARLGDELIQAGIRLACQSKVIGDVIVTIPNYLYEAYSRTCLPEAIE